MDDLVEARVQARNDKLGDSSFKESMRLNYVGPIVRLIQKVAEKLGASRSWVSSARICQVRSIFRVSSSLLPDTVPM